LNRLEFDQSYDENKKAFVERLISAGWNRKEAEQEWNRIQESDEE